MPDSTPKLTELPNIGPALARRLEAAGITSYRQLAACGSVKAFNKIKTDTGSGCTSMLYALEGAIQGIRWHDLPREIREKLKQSAFGGS